MITDNWNCSDRVTKKYRYKNHINIHDVNIIMEIEGRVKRNIFCKKSDWIIEFL